MVDSLRLEAEKKYKPLISAIEEKVEKTKKELEDLIAERSGLYHEFIEYSLSHS